MCVLRDVCERFIQHESLQEHKNGCLVVCWIRAAVCGGVAGIGTSSKWRRGVFFCKLVAHLCHYMCQACRLKTSARARAAATRTGFALHASCHSQSQMPAQDREVRRNPRQAGLESQHVSFVTVRSRSGTAVRTGWLFTKPVVGSRKCLCQDRDARRIRGEVLLQAGRVISRDNPRQDQDRGRRPRKDGVWQSGVPLLRFSVKRLAATVGRSGSAAKCAAQKWPRARLP